MQRSSAASVMSIATADGVRVHVRGRLDDASTVRLRGLLDDVGAPRSVVRVDLSRAEGLPVVVLRALRTSGLHRVLPVAARPARPPRAATRPGERSA